MPNPTHRLGDSITHFPCERRHLMMRLAAGVIGSVLLIAGFSAGAIALCGAGGWWSGWTAAVVISLLTSVISIAPLLLGICGGIQTTIAGFFAGMMLRMLLTLGGSMAAIWVWHVPPGSTLLLAAFFYLAQLIAECTTLAMAFWPKPGISAF
jgi:hypothetical protein